MAQFASTLYPQTNPSNPILLEFRAADDQEHLGSWIRQVRRGPWHEDEASDAQIRHARRVLTRLAALSG